VNILSVKCLSALVLLFAFSATGRTQDVGHPGKNGTLLVLVTWGDIDNTLADDVYVEAHGFVRNSNSEKPFVLKMPRAGRYEASLPPGVYDVFVSEGTSEPRCRRVLIKGGSTSTWTLKLEVDEVYTDK
jgi:hypothetical protein